MLNISTRCRSGQISMTINENRSTGWRDRIKDRLKALGMTQEALARKIGVTRSAITHYLAGRRVPSLNQFEKLAEVLEASPGWLQYGPYIEIPNEIADKLISSANRVPILSWEQAVRFVDVTKLNSKEVKEWVPNFVVQTTNTYALRIKGDAMIAPTGQSKSFHEGDIIVVDRGVPTKTGDFVIAILPDAKEVTFKQYVYDAGIRYLKPLNPQYPTIQIDDRIYLHAVLSWCITPQTWIALNNI